MLGGVVRGVWDDCVYECWFSVYGYFPVCVGSVDGDVQEVYLVVYFTFCCECEFWMYCVEVFQYALDV